MSEVGFMQGRLSEMVNGMIQAFPWNEWQEEFPKAQSIGLTAMEWTLDHDRLYENPLMTAKGQTRIRDLCNKHCISIPSLTGDCFMQAPFWKEIGSKRDNLMKDFTSVIDACEALKIKHIVVPLVDNGAIENIEQEEVLIEFFLNLTNNLASRQICVVFESDFEPGNLLRFVNRLDASVFGINYDIGNSAAMGFKPEQELSVYGHRVLNVHVKDRLIGGTTVPLTSGSADFPNAFNALRRCGYNGNFILQTARADDGAHAKALHYYKGLVAHWLSKN
jgi:L-ribulose-5-phosphate 3-epimerase